MQHLLKEMFIKTFAKEASKGSKNQLDYHHLADIVSKDEKFQFLNGLSYLLFSYLKFSSLLKLKIYL